MDVHEFIGYFKSEIYLLNIQYFFENPSTRNLMNRTGEFNKYSFVVPMMFLTVNYKYEIGNDRSVGIITSTEKHEL